MRLRTLARRHLILLAVLSALARIRVDRIEAHHLERSLKPGYDTFGRSCLELTFAAIANTWITLIPILMITLVFSFAVALMVSGNHPRMRFLSRSTLDLFSALPGFMIALALGAAFPDFRFTVVLATLIMVLPSTIRYFESFLLKARSEEFVHASHSLGANPVHVWVHHLFPALRDSTLSILPFILARLVLIETSISFLGVTPAPEHETWGRLIAQGKDYLIEAPWILALSGLPLCLLMASFHLLSRDEQN